MKEKFSDYESGFVSEEGVFEFEVQSYELKEGQKGPVATFEVRCEAGSMTIRHSLSPKARWSYNRLIKACMNLTPEQARNFELDYETIGNDLVGKKFMGTVECHTYEKTVKAMNDDGTYSERVEVREGFGIEEYAPVAM